MFELFNAIDDVCGFLPDFGRLGMYGLIVGVIAMLIYRWISPQKRLAAIKLEMADARQAMRSYKGTDPKEMLRLSGRSIVPALRQVLLVVGPTLIAMAPVLLIVVWLEWNYSCRLPNRGHPVKVALVPANVQGVHWAPADVVSAQPDGTFIVSWPVADQPVRLIDDAVGGEIVHLPLVRPLASISRPRWWDRVLEGGKLTQLPATASISRFELDLPSRHVWSIGPGWMRTWHTPFMIALTIAALGMKFALKIH